MGLAVFIVKLGLLVAAAVWMAGQAGEMRLTWNHWEITAPTALLGGALLLAALLGAGCYGLWRLLTIGPRGLWRQRRLHLLHRHHRQLTDGFNALAGGDYRHSMRLARQARQSASKAHISPALAEWLAAETAQQQGDRGAAQRWQKLAGQADLPAMADRALLQQQRAHGQWQQALATARHWQRQQARSPHAARELLELTARDGAFAAALEQVRQMSQRRLLDPAAARRLEACLRTAQAGSANPNHSLRQTEQLLTRALRLRPGWAPAVALLVPKLLAGGQPARATHLLRQAWQHNPTPELAALVPQLPGLRQPLDRVRQLQRWAHPANHPVVGHSLREAAAAAGLSGLAQQYASPGMAWGWHCTGCGALHPSWAASCHACGILDGVEYIPPPGKNHG